MKSDQIRRAFTEFFVERGHRHVQSAPLVPPDDPTLLFTSAGMVQFKPLYSGAVELPYRRACSVQKCLRAGGKGSDLENVGRTLRHHTFFEMLGNFSFGDYFKREALAWAWEFSTQVVRLDPARIYASVFENDDEAWEIWTREIGVPESRMVRLGTKDNFWGPAGETGACGPCSELYYDRGDKYGPGLSFQHATVEDDDPATRYIEFWNCVFPQFDQQKDGSRKPLKNRGVDTGMGFERLVCITQDCASLYETDLMAPIIGRICSIVGVPSYHEAPIEARQCVNVIADHVRALTFALSEGILPSNEGRGYVMRRLLRRASRYARRIGQESPFMQDVVESVVDAMGGAYPEIREAVQLVRRVVRAEEEAYAQTLGAGLQRLEHLLARAQGDKLSGEDVFTLSATYGLPYDDVQEIAAERGLEIDTAAYQVHVQRHREESRKGAKGTKFEAIFEPLKELFRRHGRTEFLGYPSVDGAGRVVGDYPVAAADGLEVLAIFRDGEQVSRAMAGDRVAVVLDRTPFYAESGGQVGDTGVIRQDGCLFEVTDTQKTAEDVVLHLGVMREGEMSAGGKVRAELDLERRLAVMRNHTATHLLQGALKSVVGKHVTQQGSYVGPDYLRFDFTNPEALTAEQVARIEVLVNREIMRNQPLTSRVMPMDDARKTGAIAPFGERYGTTVRVVDVPGWDIELCGGTHLPMTGGVGSMIVVTESAVASGVRRIEALTGMGAVDGTRALLDVCRALCTELSVPREKMRERVLELMEELRAQRRQIDDMRSKTAAEGAGGMLDDAEEIAAVAVVVRRLDGLEPAQLREVYDQLKSRRQKGLAAVLASVHEGRVSLVAAATPDVVARGVAAGEVVKAAAALVGGSGGGRKDMAQAGGKNPSKVQEALDAARAAIAKALGA
jgi:alanyl-tRNA synthetase